MPDVHEKGLRLEALRFFRSQPVRGQGKFPEVD